ncbi:toll/interleukin-1 receptor domain-containing protein [Spirillospora sp. NPDC050679]
MSEVFVNYRTGDADEAAVVLERALSERFGSGAVFRAAKDIRPGQTFDKELLRGVRCCKVLLAVIGPQWARHSRLREEDDWVRREILTAHELDIPVIPILKGREAPRLKAADLPPELAWLADLQSLRLDMRDSITDLRRIGDELAVRIPALERADRQAPTPANTSGAARNIFNGNRGAVHTGTGDLNNNSNHFTGDGATYIQGTNQGGVNHTFGRPSSARDDR